MEQKSTQNHFLWMTGVQWTAFGVIVAIIAVIIGYLAWRHPVSGTSLSTVEKHREHSAKSGSPAPAGIESKIPTLPTTFPHPEKEISEQIVTASTTHFDKANLWPGDLYENLKPNKVHTGTISQGKTNEYFFFENDDRVYELRLHALDFNGRLQIKYYEGDVIKDIVAADGEKNISCSFAPNPSTNYLISVSGRTKKSAGSYTLSVVQ